MKLNLVKVVFSIVGGLLLAVLFQNCSQPGSIAATETSMEKASFDYAPAPLVVDVADEMINQDNNMDQDPVDHEHDPVAEPEDDKKYNDELEEVLADYSCQDNGKKVLICHYPAGNPSARHEICISRNALKAHLNHHHDSLYQDHLGSCALEEQPAEDL